MPDIYGIHAKTFARVSAYVVMDGAERVASIAFKFPADGAGRLHAFVHYFGTEMVRGHAGGYGYDKRTAACAAAVRKMIDSRCGLDLDTSRYDAFREALAADSGDHWDSQLRKAGFQVHQAI